MSDATPADLARMTLSRQVLAGYEANGLSGRPEDNARMIRDEIAILEDFVERYPVKAETLGKVIERYRALLRTVMQ